jgi:hypothetical protein
MMPLADADEGQSAFRTLTAPSSPIDDPHTATPTILRSTRPTPVERSFEGPHDSRHRRIVIHPTLTPIRTVMPQVARWVRLTPATLGDESHNSRPKSN